MSINEPKVDYKKVPQVSIGMPVYNGELFIRSALESLLAQTYTDFELIISDNASTDDTATICRDYASKDARIRYVRQAENRGAAANFQFVLDEAVGEYFMWAAADDCWSPDWLKEVTIAMNDREYSCAIGNIAYIDEFDVQIYGDTSRGGFLTEFPALEGLKSAFLRVIKYFLMRNDMLAYGLFRTIQAKSVRIENGKYTDLPHDQVYAFLYFIITFGSIYKSKGGVIKKRIHLAQASQSGPKTLLDQFSINKNHIYLTRLYMRNSCLNTIERGALWVFMFLYLNASLIKNFRKIKS